MAAINIKGTEYNLRMDVGAMEKIEEEFGDIKDALQMFRGKSRKISTIKAMFRILANAGRRKAGLPEDVTGQEIEDLNLQGLNSLAQALNKTMDESMKAETIGGGAADDDVHDVFMEQLEEREKNA